MGPGPCMVRCAGALGGYGKKSRAPSTGYRRYLHAQKKAPPCRKNQQMAGIKGRSGGPRRNAGGARPGAGRPPGSRNRPRLIDTLPATDCPLQWLLALMNHQAAPMRLRVSAAVALLPYCHAKAK